ncbi:MAG: hypothetical protein JXB49_30455 [Bacteroidales bacterium]|nr:hypothetical protein [Bacteroidales bacterium]
MDKEKRRYTQLMIQESFEILFGDKKMDDHLKHRPVDIDSKQSEHFFKEVGMMFGISITKDMTIDEIIDYAYKAKNDEILTAEEFLN